MRTPGTDDMPRIVQFPHPGAEHVPSGAVMPWNQDPGHKRKYLISPARLVDASGATQHDGDVAFWGEWEAPSTIVHRWDTPVAELPSAVHEPYWTSPGPGGGRQNTDPWVFGAAFLYSNCKQALRTGNPTALQRLPRGSLILFGSTLNRRFVLDTVFVVDQVIDRWTPADDQDLGGDAFRTATIRSLARSEDHCATRFTLYQGATPDHPVDGMFSWVPARPRDHNWPRHPRPTLKLTDIVDPRSARSPRGAHVKRQTAEVKLAWEAAVDQTELQHLSLGCHLPTPPLRMVADEPSRASQASCSPRKPTKPIRC
jgi:hypothetical protein